MNDFNVPNLSCGHCVARVTEALHRADPAAKVEVNLKTKQVHVESTADPEALRRELAQAGYPAQ